MRMPTGPASGAPSREQAAGAPARRHGIRLRGLAGLLTGLLLGVALAGCTSAQPAPTPTQKTLEQTLADAKATLDATPALHLVLSSKDLPDGVSGLVGGDAVGTHAPAVKGKFQARIGGVQADVEIVAVEGKVWTKLPFTSIFAEVSPASLGIPDTATLLDTQRGLTSLLTKTQTLTKGSSLRRGSEVVTPVSGTLPGQVVVDLLGTGDAAGTFAATYGLVEPDLATVRTIELTGPFYGAARSTYLVVLDVPSGPVDIRRP